MKFNVKIMRILINMTDMTYFPEKKENFSTKDVNKYKEKNLHSTSELNLIV